MSVLANSVAAIESRPEAMSGAFAATSVPCASQMIAEIVSMTESTFGEALGLGWTTNLVCSCGLHSGYVFAHSP